MPKDETMKHIAPFIIASTLAGCASLPGQVERPYYDYQQQAAMAPGFPIERVDQPAGYSLADSQNSLDTAEYSAWDSGSGKVRSQWFGWSDTDGNTSTFQIGYLAVDPMTYMKPPADSQGYEFVGGQKVLHMFEAGRFTSVSSIAPPESPECAYGTSVAITSRDSKKRFVATLAEGLSCDEMGSLTPSDYQEQLERTYHMVGLN